MDSTETFSFSHAKCSLLTSDSQHGPKNPFLIAKKGTSAFRKHQFTAFKKAFGRTSNLKF